jgi:endo-1,4-beta-xylanase
MSLNPRRPVRLLAFLAVLAAVSCSPTEPVPGFAIGGWVMGPGPARGPVAGVPVLLQPDDAARGAPQQAVTGAEGRFLFASVAGNAAYRLEIQLPDSLVLAPGQDAALRIVLAGTAPPSVTLQLHHARAETELEWYVAPETVACPAPATGQCLQVRSEGSAPWTVFSGVIQDFTHETGFVHRVRLLRWRKPDPAAGEPIHEYRLLQVLAKDPVGPPPPPPSLRELAAARDFWIGAAIGDPFPNNAQYMSLLDREFNVIVAGNDMKFSYLQPNRGSFRWTRADAMVDFAEAKGMRIRGHTLVWHSAYQLPNWLTSGNWSRAELVQILETHIATVVGRYKGRIYAWDVVNEAIDDQGRMRAESFWFQRLGRDYIEIAFRAAHAADPDALLFYNDYNLEWSHPKSDSAYALVADLQARGVPIHGVGFQGHMLLNFPSRDAFQGQMNRFAGLGVVLEITELDIRMTLPVTQSKLATQATRYREVFEICLQSPACDTVVLWGVHDGDSWIPSAFPGQGAALLFDEAFAPKPAYWAVHELLKR